MVIYSCIYYWYCFLVLKFGLLMFLIQYSLQVKSKFKGHQKRITSLAFPNALNVLVSLGADAHVRTIILSKKQLLICSVLIYKSKLWSYLDCIQMIHFDMWFSALVYARNKWLGETKFQVCLSSSSWEILLQGFCSTVETFPRHVQWILQNFFYL